MIAAILSSLCLAIMVILDQLMMKDTYSNSPAQAIIVSSVGGALFGITSTLVWWFFDVHTFSEHFSNSLQWLYPYGLLVLIAGILSSQVLHQYFVCFSKNADGNIIAGWLAATPVFVYIAVAGLGVLHIIPTSNLYTFSKMLGVVLTTLGLYLLEKIPTEKNESQTPYGINLLSFMVLSVIYIILIDWTLKSGSLALDVPVQTLTISLLPWFWIGFLYGARTALKKEHRKQFSMNWSNLKKFLIPILLIEIIGMYVFFFEFIGIGELDSVSVALITSLHAMVVWLASVMLGLYHKRLSQSNQSSGHICGMTISQSALQQFSAPAIVRYKQAACVLIVIAGVLLFF